jgi:Trk K+ transport system NAD-binding subunit
VWSRGRLQPAFPDSAITPDSVLVLAGAAEQIASIDLGGPSSPPDPPPLTIVIGAGKVGHAAARALAGMHLTVRLIDRVPAALASVPTEMAETFIGDAADRTLLERAGIALARSVVLTTNDDAMNIYLAVYCRKLNPAVRIVSRVTHERNVEAIHRAGADFALSYTSLGVDAILSFLEGHDPVILGEGVRIFTVRVPTRLAGGTLGESGIGSRTGLSVVALDQNGKLSATLTADTRLSPDAELIMLGSLAQRQAFAEQYER